MLFQDLVRSVIEKWTHADTLFDYGCLSPKTGADYILLFVSHRFSDPRRQQHAKRKSNVGKTSGLRGRVLASAHKYSKKNFF